MILAKIFSTIFLMTVISCDVQGSVQSFHTLTYLPQKTAFAVASLPVQPVAKPKEEPAFFSYRTEPVLTFPESKPLIFQGPISPKSASVFPAPEQPFKPREPSPIIFKTSTPSTKGYTSPPFIPKPTPAPMPKPTPEPIPLFVKKSPIPPRFIIKEVQPAPEPLFVKELPPVFTKSSPPVYIESKPVAIQAPTVFKVAQAPAPEVSYFSTKLAPPVVYQPPSSPVVYQPPQSQVVYQEPSYFYAQEQEPSFVKSVQIPSFSLGTDW